MENWKLISKAEYDKIWDKFHKDFSFKPSIKPTDWPSIKTDKPNIKINIADFWGDTYNETKWTTLIKKGINSFISVTSQGDEILVLDWQHECYFVDPRKMTTNLNFPSFIPDGDYYIFMTKDFENIWFGHPWEKAITIIGNNLIKAYEQLDI